MTAVELLLLASLLAPGAERVGDVRPIVKGILHAVTSSKEHVYDPETDAAVMLVYAWRESNFQACARNGDSGALGTWQLMGVPEEVACCPKQAALVWYRWALAGKRRWPTGPLSGLSGGGERGALIAEQRVQFARALLASPRRAAP